MVACVCARARGRLGMCECAVSWCACAGYFLIFFKKTLNWFLVFGF